MKRLMVSMLQKLEATNAINWKTVSIGALCLIGLVGFGCSSQKSALDLGYGTYSAPNPLLQLEAKSVVRTSEVTLEVFDTQKAVYTVREAITILDKEHADLSTLVVPYDPLSSINAMQANLYNKNGMLVRSYFMKDADDYSDYDGFSFFTDNRVKVFEIFSSTYPYTVEYEYVITHKSTLNLPAWFPQTPKQSVEKASFTVIDHQTGVRFHQKNYEIEPETTEVSGAKKFTWTSEFAMPKEREPFGPHYREILPHVLVAPGAFKIDEFSGNAESWEAFGSWYFEMGKDTRVLPDAAKTEIESMVSGLTDQEEMVRVLYQHLQQKNRYVSIQLGIGGWRPFPADFVYENSYGDCKALTNYMQAILEHVGIKAEPVLIRASGVPALIEEFPSNQFNHVILKVTLNNGKVIWLECTSKYLPANNLGDGESIRALLVTEHGGEVIETPTVDVTQNKLENAFVFNLNADGSASVEAHVATVGVMQSRMLHRLLSISEREQMEWLERSIPVNNRKVEDFDFSTLTESPNEATYSYRARLGNYGNSSTKRLFVPINKMNEWTLFVPEEEDRTQAVEFRFPFSEVDSSVFVIPEKYTVEFLPESSAKESSFGKFSFQFEKLDNRTYLFKRYMAIEKPTIAPENYQELKGFLDELRKADAQQMVLIKAEAE